jgi:uncharacterized protein YjbI with pentapeptide repeats
VEQNKDRTQKSKSWALKEVGGKPLWDWLQLLIVPLVLAVAGFWFTAQQDNRQQLLENQRAASDRRLAEQQAQDDAVQGYLDRMQNLLLDRDLRDAADDSEVGSLARALTLTTLKSLDASHNRTVTTFLSENFLIGKGRSDRPPEPAQRPPVLLSNSDMNGFDLQGANLRYAYLEATDLGRANLAGADMSYSVLFDANLKDANLKGAILENAMVAGANLKGTNLHGANFEGATLAQADLTGAKGITEDQLEQQTQHPILQGVVPPLQGATMPDGSKHP